MKGNPTLSIVIPTVKSLEYMIPTLNCVFEQTMQDFEVIIVADGLDNPRRDFKQYVENYFDINKINFIINRENKSAFQSRIIGARASKGRYIHFLDADDKMSNSYHNIIAFAEKTGADIVVFNIDRPSTNVLDKGYMQIMYDLHIPEFLCSCKKMQSVANILCRRKVVQRTIESMNVDPNLYINFSEDYVLLFCLGCNARSLYVNEALGTYRYIRTLGSTMNPGNFDASYMKKLEKWFDMSREFLLDYSKRIGLPEHIIDKLDKRMHNTLHKLRLPKVNGSVR